MDALERHDLSHLSAAEGWLGLGHPAEAEAELAQITPAMRAHPDVLTMWCEICGHAKRWEEWRSQALEDPDLAPLREYLARLKEKEA